MRYLKLYEEHAEHEFIQDIKDILLEAEDIGYEAKTGSFEKGNYIVIHSQRDKDAAIGSKYFPLNYDEVKDCLLRLKNYLGNRYTSFDIYSKKDDRWQGPAELTEDYYPSEEITSVCIHYKRTSQLHESFAVGSTPIKNLINWELIEDVKEMSLEYLDEGYTLNIKVYLVELGITRIYQCRYSHSENVVWKSPLIDRYEGKFTYAMWLYHGYVRVVNIIPKLNELIERLKVAYPGEIIYIPDEFYN